MAFQCSGNKKILRTYVYNLNEKWESKYFITNANNKCVCVYV
jgi:hypothetical protein